MAYIKQTAVGYAQYGGYNVVTLPVKQGASRMLKKIQNPSQTLKMEDANRMKSKIGML